MKNFLYLASKSSSRKLLLQEANIPFTVVEQDADESKCDWGLSLQKVVESIALYKMAHAVLPVGKEGDICFALTADTLSQDPQGMLNGKPADKDDAIMKIKIAAQGINTCGTAFCLERKRCKNGIWQIEKRILKFVDARYEFKVPDHWIERYIADGNGLDAAGAIRIEGYGAQFLKIVEGSYTTIVGMPMFELREALEEIGFF